MLHVFFFFFFFFKPPNPILIQISKRSTPTDLHHADLHLAQFCSLQTQKISSCVSDIFCIRKNKLAIVASWILTRENPKLLLTSQEYLWNLFDLYSFPFNNYHCSIWYIEYQGAIEWNKLSLQTRVINSLQPFKVQLKLVSGLRAHNCQNEKVNSLHVIVTKLIGLEESVFFPLHFWIKIFVSMTNWGNFVTAWCFVNNCMLH